MPEHDRSDRLDRLHDAVSSLTVSVDRSNEHLTRQDKSLEEINRKLDGGPDPGKGMILQMDRNTRWIANATKLLWIVVVALVGLYIKTFAVLFITKQP